jgi:tetratricopeptide (TPR) repeat protein
LSEHPQKDFFVSYAGADKSWAEWIAVMLEAAGYSTLLQALDFRPGSDFVHEMHKATSTADRTIAVLSPAYAQSEYGEAEWQAAFAEDPTGERGKLVPVRVRPHEPVGLLRTRVYVDLVDLDEGSAKERLLAGVQRDRPRLTSPIFPGGVAAPDVGSGERYPGVGPEVTNLRGRNGNFTGRDDVLERLHSRLRGAVSPGGGVLGPAVEAVHGLGGVGKTELALEFAHRFASDYDIIWWIPAEQPTAAAAALTALAHRLGLQHTDDQAAAIEGLFDHLRRRTRWLLIYDNAEQPSTLRGLLPPGGAMAAVVVTSRWAVWGDRADPVRLETLSRAESVRLLERRTRRRDAAGLDELADLLGDLPLALEEAAAYLEEHAVSPATYIDLLRARARELLQLSPYRNDDPADGDRHRVATVWTVSLDQVRAQAPAAEELLTLCAFLGQRVPRSLPSEYPTALPADLAAEVGDPLRYHPLVALVRRYSLADVDDTTLSEHRLVQTVIRARLRSDEERTWAHTAVALLRAAFPDESWESAQWPRCEPLLAHVLAVTAHAERLGVADEETGWLLHRASAYLRGRGHYRQAKPLAERAVQRTERALGVDHVDVAWRCDELGNVLRKLGEFADARSQYERALQIGESVLEPDDLAIGTWRNNLGLALHALGDLVGARTQFEWALRINETNLGPNDRTVGVRRNNLGLVLHDMKDVEGARTQYELALQISEAARGPDHPDVGVRHNNLGRVLHDKGDLRGARTHFERALQIGEAALGPDHPDVGDRHDNLARVLRDEGELPGAQAHFEQARRIKEGWSRS